MNVVAGRFAQAVGGAPGDERVGSPHAEQLRSGFRYLRFDVPGLESEFHDHYWRRTLVRTQIALVLAALIFGVFALKDYRALPQEVWVWTVSIRLGLIVPVVLLCLALSFVRRLRDRFEAIIAAGVFIAMGGLSAALILAEHMGSPLPYEGLVLVIAFVYGICGLRFYKASVCTLVITIAYLVVSVLLGQSSETAAVHAYYLLTFNAIGMFGSYTSERLSRQNFLTENLAEFRASRDSLTLLHNRRAVLEHLARLWALAGRDRQSLSVLLIDVDHFKQYNDCYGHVAGDGCLSEVAMTLASRLRRPLDMVARYGGEEFVAVIYGASQLHVTQLAEALRSGVSELDIPHARSVLGRVSVSVGGCWTQPGAEGGSYAAALEVADQSLYRAKARGRNCCELATNTVARPMAA